MGFKKIKENIKKKKFIILRAFLYVFMAAGIGLILWPVYTNFMASRGVSEELSGWEEESAEIVAEDDTVIHLDQADTEEQLEDPQDSGDDPVMDMSQDGSAIQADSGLTAEDFFPMKISIPKIELEYVVYEGTDTITLKKGAGHESVTPLPGQEGRCTISGHRTTYGAPFNRVDELEEGDLIYLETLDGDRYLYAVTSLEIVKPTDVWVLEGTEKEELLLTTCHPKYSAASRLIVISELVELFPFEAGT
jgi:LPXTG-site transpeptidase (sortase) family protein